MVDKKIKIGITKKNIIILLVVLFLIIIFMFYPVINCQEKYTTAGRINEEKVVKEESYSLFEAIIKDINPENCSKEFTLLVD